MRPLVHLAPGDPLVAILPPDASGELQAQLRTLGCGTRAA
jgi:peptide/nickel transport system permease protein